MSKSEQKVVQYLDEAHAMEVGLVRVLQSQIAMTPRGRYRTTLEMHLRQTREHAERLESRLSQMRANNGTNPVQFVVGAVETVAAQAFALAKTPLDLVRGSGGEEKILKNAEDMCATEAYEIATYTSLERFAKAVGDDDTAALAASIRADEETMLDRVLRDISTLTNNVVRAEIKGEHVHDLSETGAADAIREVADATEDTVRSTASSAKRATRQARKVPGVARAEGEIKGALASEEDLAIRNYSDLTAEEIIAKLPDLSQIDVAKVDAFERKNQNRTTVLNKISTLRGDEPWPGYDELNADEVKTALDEGDDDLAKKVVEYERAHKNRTTVLRAAERELAHA